MTRSCKTLRVIFDGSIYTVIVIFVLILIVIFVLILIFIFVLVLNSYICTYTFIWLYCLIYIPDITISVPAFSYISAVSGEIPESVITILMSSSDA